MKLHQLRDFIAVADNGSLRAASRLLNVSQSAMTKSIQQLEKEVGGPLLERQKRGTTLTRLGLLFVQRARMVTAELSRAKEEIRQHLGGGAGQVVASLSTVPHMVLLPEVLGPFVKAFPAVQLTILEGLSFANVETQLRDGSIDLYVGIQPERKVGPEFTVETLFDNERVIVCRAGHPLRHAKSLTELKEARWVMSAASPSEVRLAKLFTRHRMPMPDRVTFANNILSQFVAVANADMLAMVPRQWLDFPMLKGTVSRIAVREAIPSPAIVMIRRASLPLTPLAEHFADLIRRASARMPGARQARAEAPPVAMPPKVKKEGRLRKPAVKR